MISVSFVSVLLPLYTLVTTMCGVTSKTYRPSAAAPNWPRFFICKLCLTQRKEPCIQCYNHTDILFTVHNVS